MNLEHAAPAEAAWARAEMAATSHAATRAAWRALVMATATGLSISNQSPLMLPCFVGLIWFATTVIWNVFRRREIRRTLAVYRTSAGSHVDR